MKNRQKALKAVMLMAVVLMVVFTGQLWSVQTKASEFKFGQKKYTANQGNIIDAQLFLDGVDMFNNDGYYWYWVEFTSSDPSVVSCEYSSPRFKCLNEGKAVITARNDMGQTTTCTVVVKANKLSINKKNVKVYVGEEIELALTGGKTPVNQYVEVYDLDYKRMYSEYELFSQENDCNTGIFKIKTKKEGEYYLNLVRVNDEGISYSKMVHITVEKCGPLKTQFAVAVGKSSKIEFENSDYVSMQVKSWTDADGYTHYNNSNDYSYYYWSSNEEQTVSYTSELKDYYNDPVYYTDGYSYLYNENGYDDWYDQKLLYTYYEVAWTYYYYKQAGVYFCIMENNLTYETVRIDNVTYENGMMVQKLPEEKPEDIYVPVVTPTPEITPFPTLVPTYNPTEIPTYAPTPIITQQPKPTYSDADYPAKINEKTLEIKGKSEGRMVVELTYKTPKGTLVTVDVTINVTNPKYEKFSSYLWVKDQYRANYSGTCTSSEIKIKSSDKNIVEIDDYNNIIPKSNGKCKLTITIDGVKFTDTVNVINVDVDDSIMLLSNGKSESRKVKGVPEDLKVSYSISDKTIATVSKDGLVKANKKNKYGVATVTIAIGEKNFTFAVNVGEKLGINAAKAAGSHVGKAVYSQEKRMQEGYYDCSSLVWRSYREAGVCMKNDSYAPTAADLGKYLEEKGCAIGKSPLTVEDMRPGDLLFSTSGGNNGRYLNIDHVAMYYGSSEGYSWYYDYGLYGTIVEAGSGGVRLNGYPGYGNTVIVARPSMLYSK